MYIDLLGLSPHGQPVELHCLSVDCSGIKGRVLITFIYVWLHCVRLGKSTNMLKESANVKTKVEIFVNITIK
jgi:hypothetical protein